MIRKLLPTRVLRSYLGGAELDRLEGKENPAVSRFPEDWIGSVTEAFNPGCTVKNEGLSMTEDGCYLRDIIDFDQIGMIGDRKNMSLLFKLLDASERLVIQAHPTIAFAKEHFGSEFGKTECWYILNNGGYVYLGFREGITKEKWQALFEKQDIEGMLACLHRFEVQRGDFIFVDGGVPHAIGAGCFLAELQEPTDLMVIPERVTPSGVVLPNIKLHGGLGFDKMMDCFVYKGMDEMSTRRSYFKTPQRKTSVHTVLADASVTDKFRFDRLDVAGEYRFMCDSYGIILAIEGQGTMNGIHLEAGDRFFISENESVLDLRGNFTLLLCRP